MALRKRPVRGYHVWHLATLTSASDGRVEVAVQSAPRTQHPSPRLRCSTVTCRSLCRPLQLESGSARRRPELHPTIAERTYLLRFCCSGNSDETHSHSTTIRSASSAQRRIVTSTVVIRCDSAPPPHIVSSHKASPPFRSPDTAINSPAIQVGQPVAVYPIYGRLISKKSRP